ncbi:MAG: protease inhibitor I42 family protein [Patulibacter sp.]
MINGDMMKTPYVIAGIGCILILAVVLIAGCTGSSDITVAPQTSAVPSTTSTTADIVPLFTPATTPAAVGSVTLDGSITAVRTIYVNSTANGEIITIPMGERIVVRLNENPTTGYTWNATAAKGLDIYSDTTIAPDTALIGAPGYHEWILSPQAVDTYTFKAVYYRPWEEPKATDDSFSMVILVTKD